MRRAVCLSALSLPLYLAGCGGCESDQELKDVTEDPYASDDVGSWLSLRALPDGAPAVAFYDRTQDALSYAVGAVKSGKVTWAVEHVDSFPDDNGLNPGDAGKYASMQIDGSGKIWIAYQDSTNGTLKVASSKGDGKWTAETADSGGGPSSDAGYWASLALDGSGSPVVAHYDKGKGNLRVVRYADGGFSGDVAIEGEDYTAMDTASESMSANVGEYARLVIAGGTEYLAYYDRAWGALRIGIGGKAGYEVSEVDDSGDVGQWPDVLVKGDTIWIAYHDVGNQDLRLAHGSPGHWTLETVDTGDFVGADTALFEDGDGVGILYFDGVNNNMKVARKSGDAWSVATVGADGAAVGFHNETLAVDGTRYAASYDFTNRSIWFTALN